MKLAMVFPGQGSQSVAMQSDLAARFPVVRDTYAEASDVLGYDLWRRVEEGPAERLAETVVTQPLMLTAGVAAYRVWQASNGTTPVRLAGHSLGEYSALVCAGALAFDDAVAVVRRRAELMQEAVPAGSGAMAAILGLDDAAVAETCRKVAGDAVVEPVNFNAPGQVVIAGDAVAVQRAIEALKAAGAKRALPLPVSVPAHSRLMRAAGDALAEVLGTTAIGTPGITVISASDATPYRDGDDIRVRLARQVASPVQWVRTVSALTAGGETAVIECGPGKVLAGLARRIDKSLTVASIDGESGLSEALGIAGTR